MFQKLVERENESMKQIVKSLLVLLSIFALAIPTVNAEEIVDTLTREVVNEQVKFQIVYQDNKGKSIADAEGKQLTVGELYSFEAKDIKGYQLKSEKVVKGMAEKDTTIIFEYEPVADLFIRIDATIQYENGSTGYPDSEYYYVGSTTVTGTKVFDTNAHTSTDVNFLLALHERVEKEVTTEIKDEDLIKYLNSTYDLKLSDNQAVIWYVLKSTHTTKVTRTYIDANGDKVKVEIPECLYHIDGIIVSKGNVIAKYVDEDGKDLLNSTKDTYYYGQEYKTTSKTIDNYELIKTEGEETGIVKAPETTVTYVYQFIMGEGGDDIDPEPIPEPIVVQTGVEVDYSIMTSSLVTASLLVIALRTKKKNK